MGTEPCSPWPVDPNCSHGIDPNPLTRPPVQQSAVAAASAVLWRATGGVFGQCEVTVRPCGRGCDGPVIMWPHQTLSGEWINIACGCPSACSCCDVCEVVLPGPVEDAAAILEVKVDGIVVAPSMWRLDEPNRLVRTVGDCWPMCQDLSAPDSEVGTFSVRYLRGLPVPADGQLAVAALAAEIVKACQGGPCRLPARVVELQRHGERIVLNDPDFWKTGLTGVPEADMFILSVNPSRNRRPSRVWSVDDPGDRFPVS